jgi:hypothetical protein
MRQADPKQPIPFRQDRPLTLSLKRRDLSLQRQILKGDSLVTVTEQAQEPKQIQEDGRHGLHYFPATQRRHQARIEF